MNRYVKDLVDQQKASREVRPPAMGHRFDKDLRCHTCNITIESHQKRRSSCPNPSKKGGGRRPKTALYRYLKDKGIKFSAVGKKAGVCERGMTRVAKGQGLEGEADKVWEVLVMIHEGTFHE